MGKRTIVVGGGLAGLVVAVRLLRAGEDVVCLDGAEAPGGAVRTDVISGYRCERGPQSFFEEPDGPVKRLARDLGVADRITRPHDRARGRFVLHAGRPRRMPHEVFRVLTHAGLVRMLREPFVPPMAAGEDESVAAWARRRFGPEAAVRLFDALVAGIFAGDAERLSMRSALERAWRLEHLHGSVVAARLRGTFIPRESATFAGGMATLPQSLAFALGDRLRLSVRVISISRPDEQLGVRFRVRVEDQHTRAAETLAADRIVLATPAPTSAALLHEDVSSEIATVLRGIPYAPIASLALGLAPAMFRRSPPAGFGVLAPRREGVRVLGCLYVSSCFAETAPADRVHLRVMLGGRLRPELVSESDARLTEIALWDLGPILGLRYDARPELAYVVRHHLGIPQYEVGHAERLRRLDHLVGAIPGLHLAGNAYRGVSVRDVVDEAEQLARRLAGRSDGSEVVGAYRPPVTPSSARS